MTAHAALQPLAGDLGRQRYRKADAVRWALTKIHLGRRIRRLSRSLFDEFPDGSAGQATRAAFASAAALAADRLARRDGSDEALHRARLAIKKLRYMSEALEGWLPPGAAAWREDLHRRQRLLGEMRDVQALVDRLRRYRSKIPADRREVRLVSDALRRKRRGLLQRHERRRGLRMPRSLQAWLAGD
jgi:CHAD domain-containing protein